MSAENNFDRIDRRRFLKGAAAFGALLALDACNFSDAQATTPTLIPPLSTLIPIQEVLPTATPEPSDTSTASPTSTLEPTTGFPDLTPETTLFPDILSEFLQNFYFDLMTGQYINKQDGRVYKVQIKLPNNQNQTCSASIEVVFTEVPGTCTPTPTEVLRPTRTPHFVRPTQTPNVQQPSSTPQPRVTNPPPATEVPPTHVPTQPVVPSATPRPLPTSTPKPIPTSTEIPPTQIPTQPPPTRIP